MMKADRNNDLLPEWFYEVLDRIYKEYEVAMWMEPETVPEWYKELRKRKHDARTNDRRTEEGS